MARDHTELLVVGGGPAGTAAARRAAELGAAVTLVESTHLGGTCVNTGCVPTRVLAKTARLLREVRRADAYGIEVGDVSVRWETTVARVREVVRQVKDAKALQSDLTTAGVTARLGLRARFVDDRSVELVAADGGSSKLGFDRCILAIGGHSRRLPIPGAEHAVFAEHVLDVERLPRSVAIIGSGATGSQLVTIFNALGAEVTLLELADRILPAADHDVAAALTRSFEGHGVDVVTGIDGVSAIEHRSSSTGGGYRLRIESDGWARSVDADLVVMSAGWPANLEGLGLEDAGITAERGVIPTNSYQQTNVPHIFVAGDANGVAMLVQSAESEGEAAAVNAVLGPTRSVPHGLLPWGGFTDPDVAGVGLTEEVARERDADAHVVTVAYSEMERPIIDDRAEGFLKLVADRRRTLLLGAHAVGESAVEVIQAVTTAMAAGVDVATLARVEFAYPTYSAVLGEAARRILAARS